MSRASATPSLSQVVSTQRVDTSVHRRSPPPLMLSIVCKLGVALD